MPEPEMTKKERAAYEEALRRIEQCRKGPLLGRELFLGELGLTQLPPEIGQLSQLTKLDLYHNQLTSLPPELGQLSKLTELDLSINQLTSLPLEFGQLSKLTTLGLRNNQLASLPPEFGKLFRLAELYLHDNQLASLPPEFGQLSNLTTLYLSSNRLTALPPEFGQCSNLTELRLQNNRLTSLPPEFRELSNLSELDLHNNQLASLPPEFGQLSKLTELYLHGNPELGLPPEVVGPTWDEVVIERAKPAKPQDILDYYFSRRIQGEQPLNEVRLVLVGRGAAGKTSIVRRLVTGQFKPDEDETPGIALSDWALPDCPGGAVTAHVWDFAGQMILHSMHRYFLSHRTVYVLVLAQREDSAMDDADYWLKLVQSYGTDKGDGQHAAPVIVALNKSDKAPVKVDRNALKERYPFIVDFVETDCRSGRGIADLKAKLCRLMDDERVKPWVRMGFPVQWWAVKDAVVREQKTRPHLGYDEWRTLCSTHGVRESEQQDRVSRILHTLGVALNYADDDRLHDNTVLRPNWVTGHCYNLVRHAEKNEGVLRRAELAPVLGAGDEGEKDPAMHLYLMRLMERFEAAYPMGEEWPPERWLVPLGLPDNQKLGVEVFGQTPPTEATRLRYTYPGVPGGLIAQFVVRTHPLMEPQMQWASGTVLALAGARALVRAISKTEVEVTVINNSSEARRDLAGLCRDELKSLHQQIAGLDPKEETQAVADSEVVWVPMKTLEKDEEKERQTTAVPTSEGTAEVVTAKELDKFSVEDARLEEESHDETMRRIEHYAALEHHMRTGRKPKRKSNPKPVLFISYSHRDERHRKTLELYLDVLKNQGLLHKVWHDRRIQPGMDWDKEIQEQISRADIVIFLTSTASLASDYINSDELRPSLERHVDGEAIVVPVILERCDWVATFAACPPLKKLKDPKRRVPQALPRDNEPIHSFNPRSDGWYHVMLGLKEKLTELKKGLK